MIGFRALARALATLLVIALSPVNPQTALKISIKLGLRLPGRPQVEAALTYQGCRWWR
jgi:hypothetical protein